jgi:hypothetical protein
MIITAAFVFTFFSLHILNFNGKRVDDIETGYRLDDRGSILETEEIFLYFTTPRPALEPIQPSIRLVLWGYFPGVLKRLEDEADHSTFK